MPRQSNFTGGEIAPELYGRTDVARYASAVRTCLNFISTPLGPLQNRTGTVFTREVQDSARTTRIVSFVFSNDQSYVLEFGHHNIRVFSDGGVVEDPPGTPVDIATTYDEDDLFLLQFAQSGDVLTIVHPDYVPRELIRSSHEVWTIADIDFDIPNGPTGLTAAASGVAGAGQIAKNWWVAVTSVKNGRETRADTFALPSYVIYPDVPASYSWTVPAAGADYYNVYRSRHSGSGPYGYIGSSLLNAFSDDGQAPDYTAQPPVLSTPFEGGNPASVCYFQGRRVFGGSSTAPDTLFGTRVGVFEDFDKQSDLTLGTEDPDPFHHNLASRTFEEIRAVVPGVTLLTMTSGAEWTVIGGQDTPLTPTNIDARPRSQWGSAWLPPLVLGDVVLFVPVGAASVRDLENDAAVGSLRGRDLTLLAPHLFRGHTVVDWCLQRKPFPIVWAVRDDGVLLGLTYVREQEVWAWHRHETEGFFESVCSVPEGNIDALYCVVLRVVDGVSVRYVERFAERPETEDDLLTCVFTDSAIAFDGRNDDATTMTVSGATWTPGSVVTVLASAAAFAAGDVGDHLVLDPDGEAIRILVTAYTDTTHISGELQAEMPAELQAVATSDWAWARDTFSGLDHLEGLEVYGLSDGDAVGPLTVSGGVLTLTGTPAVDLTVGLRYLSDGELLDVADPKNEQKRVTRAFIEVVGSRGLKAGESFDGNLDTWTQREVADGFSYLPADATVVEILIEGTWNRGGRVVFRQEDPLPLTVLAVTRELAMGGK